KVASAEGKISGLQTNEETLGGNLDELATKQGNLAAKQETLRSGQSRLEGHETQLSGRVDATGRATAIALEAVTPRGPNWAINDWKPFGKLPVNVMVSANVTDPGFVFGMEEVFKYADWQVHDVAFDGRPLEGVTIEYIEHESPSPAEQNARLAAAKLCRHLNA